MDSHWLLFSIILITNAFAAFAVGLVLWRRPRKTGHNSMTFLLIGLGIWSFAYAMITIMPALEWKLFWLKIENIGILTVPVHWFFFAVKYARLDKRLTRNPLQALFFAIPALSLIMLFSDSGFHIYYSDVQAASPTGGPLIISRGPLYWVAFLQAYVLILAGMGVLIWRFIRSRHTYRRQLPYLLAAVIVPFGLNLIYQFNPGILPVFHAPVDLTPLSFNITAVLLTTSIFGLRLFDLIPIARDTVMEHIPEMVFVLDNNDRVLDANAMAQKWLGMNIEDMAGQDALEVFRPWPQLLQHFFWMEHSREEIEIPGPFPRTLEVIVTPVYNQRNVMEGRVIVAYDVTERKALENKLKALNTSLQDQLNENEQLRLQLQEQAIRDPLTGVFNRRFFAEELEREAARAARERSEYTILIIDVDHFKKFNDTYGHKCGDFVLKTLAEFLVASTRLSDIVCRYGGEEFVILMPNTAVEHARERAEFLREQFEAMQMEFGGRDLRATFSAGIASHPVHSTSAETLLALADQALYSSKSNGRNRVSVYSPDAQYDIPFK